MSISNAIHTLNPVVSSSSTSSLKPISSNVKADLKSVQDAKTDSTASVHDQTTLSSAATLLASALQGSDVRTEKVASLQAAISDGTYNVASSDVADKLIDSLLS